jgi:hypothetical protein
MRKKLSSMQYGKTHFAILMISILSLSFFFPGVPVFGGQGQGKLRVVAIQGRAKVEGQDAIVEILVAVQPGENAKAKAREKLRRMYPDAEEIDSSNYSLTGLDWNKDSDFQNNNHQVLFLYNGVGVPVSNDASVKYEAYNTWNSVGTSIFEFKDNGTTSGCPSLVKECKGRQYFNGDNEIAWLDIRESSVLGVVWSGTSSTGPEFDMALDNADFDWYVGADPGGISGNQIDLQTVWLHEFGHGLGLGHSNVTDSVMEAIYDKPRRVLHSDDIAGITSIYKASSADLPPTVTIASPADGSTHLLGDSISFAGTADDNEDGDLTARLDWASSIDGPLALGSSNFSAVLSVGVHNITATVVDSSKVTGSDSVGVTVIVPGVGDSNDIYVWAIDFSEKRKGRGGSLVDLITTVTIRRDSDANGSAEDTDVLVGGASIQMTLVRDGNSFNFSGTTNSEGIAKFTLQHALLNTPYTATINSVSHSTYIYDNLLNVETQDTHTIQ